jgi:hypothetical protein
VSASGSSSSPAQSLPCSQITLLGRRLDEQTMLEIADGVRRAG